MSPRAGILLRIILAAWAFALTPRVFAHPALSTVVTADVRVEGHAAVVDVYITHDALAYALNDTSLRVTDPQMYALLDGPREELAATLQDGRERFQNAFKVFADDRPIDIELLASPDLESVDRWRADNPSEQLPLKLSFEVRAILPEGVSTLSLRAPPVMGDLVMGLSRPGVEPVYMPLSAGQRSPEFDVSMLWPLAPGLPDTHADATLSGRMPHARPPRDAVGHWGTFWRYLVLGYRHIVPEGHDHELFILGLFLLNTRLKDLLWQTTAFTLAHSTTLTLATFHLVAVPSSLVEPVIALSIAFIAIENVFARKVHPWRIAIAFLFGLVHGLGFASGLVEIGLPTSQLVTGLIAFNVGVEGGHLTVLALAFVTIGWFRNRAWYRPAISIPLSVLIALIATAWFVERVL